MFAEVFSYDQELIERGEEKKAIEMATSLLEAGMSADEVSRHSKLSLEVIENLISTLKNL